MAHVELTLSPLPAHVRTARLVVVAAARRAGLDGALVDELRLAVGEAASRAVALHRRHAPESPVLVTVNDDASGLVITVKDEGPSAAPPSDDVAGDLLGGDDGDVDDLVDPDVSLAVLSGLLDECEIEATSSGTTVTMRWPLPPGPLGVTGPGATAVSQP